MKTIKIIIACLLGIIGTQQVLGQQEKPQTKNLDAFVGTWEYKTATETFQIVFIKGRENTKFFLTDCIIGGYLYIKNGVTIGDYTKNLPPEYNSNNRSSVTIFATNAKADASKINPNVINLWFTDRKLNKTTTGFGKYRNNFTLLSPTQARFQLFEDEGEWKDDRPLPPEGFSVPTDVVMKKIK